MQYFFYCNWDPSFEKRSETYYKLSVLAYYSLNLKDFVRDLFALV